MTEREIRVRLRHARVTLMVFLFGEERAAPLAAGDRSDLIAAAPRDMEFTPPAGEHPSVDATLP